MCTHPGLKEFCAKLQALPVPSAPLLCFMVSLYEEEVNLHKDTPQGKQSLDNALEVHKLNGFLCIKNFFMHLKLIFCAIAVN